MCVVGRCGTSSLVFAFPSEAPTTLTIHDVIGHTTIYTRTRCDCGGTQVHDPKGAEDTGFISQEFAGSYEDS